MRKFWICVGITGMCGIIWLISQNRISVEKPSFEDHVNAEKAGAERENEVMVRARSVPSSSMVPRVHPLAASLGSASIPPEKEPEILLEILEAYRRVTGSFPVAEDNRHVMELLTSSRATVTGIFPRHHPRLNDGGELIDGWGTPYFFHHISRQQIEVRSAGPDGIYYTPDDIILPRRT